MKARSTKKQRTAISEACFTVSGRYWPSLSDPLSVLRERFLDAELPDTADEVDGIYCGEQGRATFGVDADHAVIFEWYKFQTTGRYEVTAYLS